MSAQRRLLFSWCFPAMGTICNDRNACLTAHLLRFDAIPPTGCRCGIMSAFVFLLGIVPAHSGSIQLVPGRQTDACLIDRQGGGGWKYSLLSGTGPGHTSCSKTDGSPALCQSQSCNSAQDGRQKWGSIQRNTDVRGAHLGMQTWRYPGRLSQSRRSSLSPFLPAHETPREARSWMYCRRWNLWLREIRYREKLVNLSSMGRSWNTKVKPTTRERLFASPWCFFCAELLVIRGENVVVFTSTRQKLGLIPVSARCPQWVGSGREL